MINIVLRGPRAAVVFACLSLSVPVGATTYLVTPTSAATLAATFAKAQGGDTIKVSGTFSGAVLSNSTFTKLTTLDLTAAVFTSTLELNNVDNLAVSGGTFNLAGDAAWTRGIQINGGRNVYVNKPKISGSGTQWGVSIVGTANAQVSGGTFNLLNAAILYGSASGQAAHNLITGSTSDGIDIANSHTVTASYNSCSGGVPAAGVHPDCIQLWSVAGDPLQSDIIVSHNIAKGSTQGFTSFSSGGGGVRLQFLGNIVATSSFPQGVACYDCVDSMVTGNSVSTLPGSTFQTTINVVGGSNNLVSGNTIAAYLPAKPPTSGVKPLSLLAGASANTMSFGISATAGRFTTLLPTAGVPAGIAAVPEPSSWSMLIAGFAAVGLGHRRRRADA